MELLAYFLTKNYRCHWGGYFRKQLKRERQTDILTDSLKQVKAQSKLLSVVEGIHERLTLKFWLADYLDIVNHANLFL